MDLLELRRLRAHKHPATGSKPWYANIGTQQPQVSERLNDLAPLYASVSGSGFGNLTGDALELIVYKSLNSVYLDNRRYSYQGQFLLAAPKTPEGRYRKIQPPKALGGHVTQKEADFLQFGHAAGPLSIECKNYREWIYPHHHIISELIIKASDLGAIPVLVARRLHYTTRTNLLEPAGIIAHESLFQYYPADKPELANKVRHKRSLGFTDVLASEEPHHRTMLFFSKILPKIVDHMSKRWFKNIDALAAYARGELNLAQIYSEIDSPAGGKWQEFQEPKQENYEPE